jgi:type VI secretion system secreted protein Hcp
MAADYYLKIGDIKGEVMVKTDGLEGTMQIQSFSWGAANATSWTAGSGLSGGKVHFSPFSFNITQGQAAATMLLGCCVGKHYDTAKLVCRKSTGDDAPKPFLEIEFCDLVIETFATNGSGAPDIYDSCSFAFTKITYVYLTQNQDGTVNRSNAMTYDTKAVEGAAA